MTICTNLYVPAEYVKPVAKNKEYITKKQVKKEDDSVLEKALINNLFFISNAD